MKKKCVVIGDLNVDIIVSNLRDLPVLGKEVIAKDHYLDIGGSGGIFSASLSGLGVDTCIISKIGDDFFGSYLIKKLKSFGVDTGYLVVKPASDTGVTVNLSYRKDKFQISSLKLVNNFKLDEILFERLKNVSHVHFTSYYVMDGLKENYLKIIDYVRENIRGATISMDTNDDPRDKWSSGIHKILSKVDIFFANEKEAIKISGKDNVKDAVDKLSRIVSTVIVKMGSEGYVAKVKGKYYKSESKKINFKDTTGSGDNFNAGYIYGLMNKKNTEDSLEVANTCGGIATEYMGGVGNHEKFKRIAKIINDKGDTNE